MPHHLKLRRPVRERDLLFGRVGFRLMRQGPDMMMLLVHHL